MSNVAIESGSSEVYNLNIRIYETTSEPPKLREKTYNNGESS